MPVAQAKWVGRELLFDLTDVETSLQTAHIAAVSAPAAVTSTQNATTGASAPSVGYVQAEAVTTANLANALKVSYNAAQADIAALRATNAALVTALNTLVTQLQSAGILSAS